MRVVAAEVEVVVAAVAVADRSYRLHSVSMTPPDRPGGASSIDHFVGAG